MSHEELDPHMWAIIRKMCEAVGMDDEEFDAWDFTEPGWSSAKTWTTAEEEAFKAWWIVYMQKNRAARIELYNSGRRMSKKELSTAWLWFTLDIGWRHGHDARGGRHAGGSVPEHGG